MLTLNKKYPHDNHCSPCIRLREDTNIGLKFRSREDIGLLDKILSIAIGFITIGELNSMYLYQTVLV